MNGNVHLWIVRDAVIYINGWGSDYEKKALQTLQNAYGEKRPINEIPYWAGAVLNIAGVESKNTDYYRDLIAESNLLGLYQGVNYEWGGNYCTALNHFINAFIFKNTTWWTRNGYHYWWSSKNGSDYRAMIGPGNLVDYSDTKVSMQSDVFQRIAPFWTNASYSMYDNFKKEFRNVMFAPVSVLAHFYYSWLILHHFDPLRVEGPNKYIEGLNLLGPVLHAIADACVPQHVRPAMGFCHQTWENYVEADVYNSKIHLDGDLVGRILSQSPFNPWWTYTDGPLKGKLATVVIVNSIANMTVSTLMRSTKKSFRQLYSANEDFWNSYVLDTGKRVSDAHYLYNLAVAGTVHTIVRACTDLTNAGIISPDSGLIRPEPKPKPKPKPRPKGMLGITSQNLEYLVKKKSDTIGTPPTEKLRTVSFSKVMDLLGFPPVEPTQLQSLLDSANSLFNVDTVDRLELQRVSEKLYSIEESLVSHYVEIEKNQSIDFHPLRTIEKMSFNYEMSAHFGTGTFRLPSLEECREAKLFQQYMNQLDMHVYKAYLFELTRVIASLKFYAQKSREKNAIDPHIQQMIAKMEQFREQAINSRGIPVIDSDKHEVEFIDIPEEPIELSKPEYAETNTRPY